MTSRSKDKSLENTFQHSTFKHTLYRASTEMSDLAFSHQVLKATSSRPLHKIHLLKQART
ncbi:hypothetical protein BGZ95_003179 [Linnemannia exigua]|uniref:Uncharacterized protein n=1 Tax=Linnemannia exigua TaxID=604196 RepID=A0AAD4H2K2_9FUNG|nr:hypothetical protein BGZ95_003179 [Linnemannia exigua]